MIAKLDNLGLFLTALNHFGIVISGISAEDLYGGHEEILTVVLIALVKRFCYINIHSFVEMITEM